MRGGRRGLKLLVRTQELVETVLRRVVRRSVRGEGFGADAQEHADRLHVVCACLCVLGCGVRWEGAREQTTVWSPCKSRFAWATQGMGWMEV